MIVCPACKHRNPEDAEVCEACGENLEDFLYRACPACGALNPAENVFCHRCLERLKGAAPEAAEQPPAAEERMTEGEETLAETTEKEEESIPSFLSEEAEEAEVAAEEEPPLEEEPAETLPPFIETERREEPLTREEEPLAEKRPPSEEQTTETEQAPAPPDEQAPETEEGEEVLPQIATHPLEGIEDGLPLEVGVSLPHRADPLSSEEPTEEERADAELLRRIAEEGAPLQEAPSKAEGKEPQPLSRLGRVLLHLMVLLAALAPFFTGGQTAHWVLPRRDIGGLVDMTSTLSVHTPVLVSFDYSPSYAGELDPLALALVRQLASRSVPIVAMSTKPEGIGVAEKICATVAGEMEDYRYGEDYAILGYLSGQEAGLRTLKKGVGYAFKKDHVQHRALSELPVTSGIDSVADMEHVIVLSDENNIVRRWIEQVRRGDIVLLHALVSTRIEPLLVPYEQAGQLETLIGGAYGAAEYEKASGMEGMAARTVDADIFLFLVMLLIAVITNVVYVSKE
ncbi:MAG: zinc ribbon domain-containing protein [Anaerolineae bacterium]